MLNQATRNRPISPSHITQHPASDLSRWKLHASREEKLLTVVAESQQIVKRLGSRNRVATKKTPDDLVSTGTR